MRTPSMLRPMHSGDGASYALRWSLSRNFDCRLFERRPGKTSWTWSCSKSNSGVVAVNHSDSNKSRIISSDMEGDKGTKGVAVEEIYSRALTRRKTWAMCYMVSHWRVFQWRERWSRKAPVRIRARTCVHTVVYHSGWDGKRERGRSHDTASCCAWFCATLDSANWFTVYRDFAISHGLLVTLPWPRRCWPL